MGELLRERFLIIGAGHLTKVEPRNIMRKTAHPYLFFKERSTPMLGPYHLTSFLTFPQAIFVKIVKSMRLSYYRYLFPYHRGKAVTPYISLPLLPYYLWVCVYTYEGVLHVY